MSHQAANISANSNGKAQSASAGNGVQDSFAVGPNDRLLITGAAGFIGSCVVESLLDMGFRNLVCFVRPSSKMARLEAIIDRRPAGARVEVYTGNLLARADCDAACKDAAAVFNLAAGTGEKSYPDAFMNSVVTTRNLLEACRRSPSFKRFVLVSSFTVYTNRQRSRKLDEQCPTEENPERGRDAYCYAKVKQEQMVRDFSRDFGIPYVVVRPGAVYGASKGEITGRVGLGTFGIFLHLGGSNTIPFTYVKNCADAIALAGLVKGIDGEIFNVVDDNPPSSRDFLRQYKKHLRGFRSLYLPHVASYFLCYLWEKYSDWSRGQLPPAFNRNRWYVEWRKTRYSNEKLKKKLGWAPKVSTQDALKLYFSGRAQGGSNA